MLVRWLRNWLWGYDFFVSYHWSSGGTYAVNLAARLREKGYDVFLDQAEYAKGDDWKEIGAIALRNTQRLVLIATREAVFESDPVKNEVLEFSKSGRQIIPIFFGDTFSAEEKPEPGRYPVLDLLPDTKIYIEDTVVNLQEGCPPQAVVKDLVAAHGIMRRRRLRQLVTLCAVCLFAVFLILAGFSWSNALLEKKLRKIADHNAELRRQMATSFRLAEQSRKEIGVFNRLYLAALLAAESLKLYPTAEADQLLRQSLQLLPSFVESPLLEQTIEQLEFTGDRRFVVGRSHRQLVVLEPDTMHSLSIPTINARVNCLAVSDEGDRFAATTDDNRLLIYESDDLESVTEFTTKHKMNQICFSGDGRFVAPVVSNPSGNVIQVFNVEGKITTRQIETGPVVMIELSKAGTYLAWSDETQVRLWNLAQNVALPPLEHGASVEKLQFDPEHEFELVTFDGTDIYRWNVRSNVLTRRSRNSEKSVCGQIERRFLSKDLKVALAEEDNELFIEYVDEFEDTVFFMRGQAAIYRPGLVDYESPRLRLGVELSSRREFVSLDIVGKARTAVVHSPKNTLRIFSLDDQIEVARVCGDAPPVVYEVGPRPVITAWRLSRDGDALAVAFAVNERVGSDVVNRGSVVRVFATYGYHGAASIGHSPAFAPTNRSVFSLREGSYVALRDGGVVCTNLVTQETSWVLNLRDNPQASTISLDPNGHFLAVGTDAATAYLVDLRDTEQASSYRKVSHDGSRSIKSITFQHDGTRFATAGRDNTARVWTVPGAEHVVSVQHHDGTNQSVNKVCFSPNGKWLGTASGDKTAAIWSLPDGRCLAKLEHDAWVEDIAFSPDNQYVATVSEYPEGSGCLWSAPNGEQLWKVDFKAYGNALAFHPDGDRVAFAVGNWGGIRGGQGDQSLGFVEVREVPSGRLTRRFIVPTRTVKDVAFAPPDGAFLACVTSAGVCHFWSMSEGQEVVRLPMSSTTVVFSKDGKFVAGNGQVQLWRTKDLIAEATLRLPRTLTADERDLYLTPALQDPD